MENLFFIYCTLKQDSHNHLILNEISAKYIGDCSTVEKYPLYTAGDPFPYLSNDKGLGKIVEGELYSIMDSKIERLDKFESVPSLYVKGKITVKIEGKIYEDVNVYFDARNISYKKVNFLERF